VSQFYHAQRLIGLALAVGDPDSTANTAASDFVRGWHRDCHWDHPKC
jgi:hypothetical protein